MRDYKTRGSRFIREKKKAKKTSRQQQGGKREMEKVFPFSKPMNFHLASQLVTAAALLCSILYWRLSRHVRDKPLVCLLRGPRSKCGLPKYSDFEEATVYNALVFFRNVHKWDYDILECVLALHVEFFDVRRCYVMGKIFKIRLLGFRVKIEWR